MNRDRLIKQLTIDEGKRNKPYKDTVGKITIGIGRNLDDVGVSDIEARYLLDNDIDRVVRGLDLHLPWWRKLDDVRQEVLVNMAFNMGLASLLGFQNTLAAVRDGRYDDAAEGMRNSLWFQQVGDRARRLIAMMRTGNVP